MSISFETDGRFFKPSGNTEEWYFEIWPERGPAPERAFLTPDVIVNVHREGDGFKVGYSAIGQDMVYETLTDENAAYKRCIEIHQNGR